MTFKEYLYNGLNEYGIKITDDQAQKFEKYKDLLVEWNENVNLTAITDDEGVAIKHMVDSVCMLEKLAAYIPENGKIIDVGTGAGFPGIPMKIMNPGYEVVLLDSLNKRLKFLDEVCGELKLTGIRSVHFRAEDGGQDPSLREQFDVSIARAVGSLSVLLEYCVPFVKVGGHFLAMKSKDVDEEIAGSGKALRELGCEIKEVIRFKISTSQGEMDRAIIVVKKMEKTKDKYPRKAGTPAKKPL